MGKQTFEINTLLVKDMSIREITSMVLRLKSGKVAGIDDNVALAARFVYQDLKRYRFTDAGMMLSFERFCQCRQSVAHDFLEIHRLNHFVYSSIQRVCDWAENKGMLTSNAMRYFKKIERTYSDYQSTHLKTIDLASYRTVQDHLRLAYNHISPLIEPLEVSIRDYLISKRSQLLECGQKDDIILLTKIHAGLMFCAALRNTRADFFIKRMEEYGVDFSSDYAYADITSVSRNFVWMMEQLGVKFTKDKDDDYVLKGVDFDKSVRINSEWSKIVSVVTDVDLMNETALEAINRNPETKADYEAQCAREDAIEMAAAIDKLRQNPNVRTL